MKTLIINAQPTHDGKLSPTLRLAGFLVVEEPLDPNVVSHILEHAPQALLLNSATTGSEMFEFCRKLKSDPLLRTIPTFIIADPGNEEEAVEALEMGAIDCLFRPIQTKALQAKIRAAVRVRDDLDNINRRNVLLAEMAMTDELTGLKNLRAFREALASESSLSRLRNQPLSLVLFDIDHFKIYNDSFGHAAGDEVLQRFGRILGVLGQNDWVAARNGGKEFVVLIPNADADEALAFAEKLRRTIAGQTWPHRAITASFGVATAVGDGLELVSRADRALSRSKRLGHNQVTHARDIEFDIQPRPGSTTGSIVEADLRTTHVTIVSQPPAPLVLHVDDNEATRYIVNRILAGAGFRSETATTGTEVMGRALAERADLIILDVVLPDIDGFEVCRRLKSNPATAAIPILHLSAQFVRGRDRALALDLGADAYLAQPVEPDELIATARALIRIRSAEEALRRSRDQLESAVEARTAQLEQSYDATIEALARALELRDHETEGHSRRVTEMTLRLARALGVPDSDLTNFRRGALLHDIGKIGIPDRVLLKAGPLDAEEIAIMQKHPSYAGDLLRSIDFLRPALDIPLSHHESWDGRGYPQGLKGTEIPLAARIFAVVDVWDALSNDRPYRRAWPEQKVRDHLAKIAGTHLDPNIVPIFLDVVLPKLKASRQEMIAPPT